MAKKKPGVKPSQVLAAVNDAGSDLDIQRLAEELLDAFGGAKAFGLLLKQEYDSDASTSIARANILQSVLRVITQAANKRTGQQDLSGLTQEELEAQVGRLLKRAMASTPTEAGDGEA
jgi:DNA-nicking Smr family endonuclease